VLFGWILQKIYDKWNCLLLFTNKKHTTMKMVENDPKKVDKKYDKEYPENGDNHKAGKEEAGPLPNNPAKNADLTSPEEDKKKKGK
jgi:hypothetical protein